jgi:hypothetical protein
VPRISGASSSRCSSRVIRPPSRPAITRPFDASAQPFDHLVRRQRALRRIQHADESHQACRGSRRLALRRRYHTKVRVSNACPLTRGLRVVHDLHVQRDGGDPTVRHGHHEFRARHRPTAKPSATAGGIITTGTPCRVAPWPLKCRPLTAVESRRGVAPLSSRSSNCARSVWRTWLRSLKSSSARPRAKYRLAW